MTGAAREQHGAGSATRPGIGAGGRQDPEVRTRRAPASDPGPDAGRARAGADPIRVLIVDDHASLAGAMAMAINGRAGMRCVGSVVSIAGALTAVTTLDPDVVLLDVFLPDGNGIDVIPQLLAARPGVRILVLTGHTDVDALARAATAGASGFLPKESTIEAVIAAIKAASEGQLLVDGTTLASILGRLAQSSRQAREVVDQVPTLTPREHDVLALMGQGLDPHAISLELGISVNTTRGYLKGLMRKLGAHSQLEVIVISSRNGLLPQATGLPRPTGS